MNRLDLPDGHLSYVSAGSGVPPVVLLHAGYVDHRMYERETRHLAARTTVVAPDARSHGWSSTGMARFRHCDDVAALVRALGEPAVLVGTSMGAGAAIDTALEHPDLVRALVICGAGTNEPTFEDPRALTLFARQQEAIARQDVPAWLEATVAWAAGPSRTLQEVDPSVVRRLREMNEHFVRTHIRPGIVPPEHVTGSWERLGEIAVPVLGIVGELDFADHHRMTRAAVSAVQDGRGVVTVPGAGHFPNLENPTAWEEAVDAFLDEVLAPEVAAPRRT